MGNGPSHIIIKLTLNIDILMTVSLKLIEIFYIF